MALRIAMLAAGAGGMLCGSCLRDNALARTLKRTGHEVTLVPLYTPLRVEGEPVSIDRVFYGGVNAYLQHASSIFRRTPRLVDWLLDRPWLLKWAGSKGATTSPADVAELTISILHGEEGTVVKELRRLVEFLKQEVRPEIVTLPNLMFIGAARVLKEELGAAVVCELTGEDIFLEGMSGVDQERVRRIIRERVPDVSRFVATSAYYAGKMSAYLGIEPERIAVVYPGVPAGEMGRGAHPAAARALNAGVVGYLARICPEKGLERLIAAMPRLKSRLGDGVQVRAAGYLSPAHRTWLDQLRQRLAADGLDRQFRYVGELTEQEKSQFLMEIDVLCVPTAYPEPKGIYVLEALAAGKAVVVPNHGAFPELIEKTGGGVLVEPGNADALANAVADLVEDPMRLRELGERGRQAVVAAFTEDHMAVKMARVFEEARA